jgi:hypothetical protein
MTCPRCQLANAVTAPFCNGCGYWFTSAPARPAANFGPLIAWLIVAAIAIAGVGLFWFIATEPQREKRAAEVARYGPEPSVGRQGVATAVWEFYRISANDARSIEVVEAGPIMPSHDKSWKQRVLFRGKNAFGALIIDERTFYIRDDVVIEMSEN